MDRFFHEMQQQIPELLDFISITGHRPAKWTSLDYYLRVAEKSAKEGCKEYTITTFDLGVCIKAFPLQCDDQEIYNDNSLLKEMPLNSQILRWFFRN